jgi:hypothetical protein
MNSKTGTAWPIGIFVFYGVFVVALVIAVFISVNNDMEMVTDNYYEKTLKYEEQIGRIRNTDTLPEKPQAVLSKDKAFLILTMPEISGTRDFKGDIHLFRPSNFRLDRKIPLQLSKQGIQLIPVSDLDTGKWQVQIQWAVAEKEYYFEKVLIL